MKYEEWVNHWLKNYIKPTSKMRTYKNYSNVIKNHIAPKIGKSDLSELTPYALQSYVTELLSASNTKTSKGLSANTVNLIITIVQNSLKTAFDLEMTNVYSADRIKRPKLQENPIECFSISEQKKIEKYIKNGNDIMLYGVIICLYTGLRLGELLALEWSDIDFGKAEMYITKTCHDAKCDDESYSKIIDTPKTQSSIRTIPLPKQLLPILKSIKSKKRSTYVISKTSNYEKHVSLRAYQRKFERMLNRLNIPYRCFHTLRHTFATRALECGMDVKTLSEILGHKNSCITLNRYAHSLTKHKKEMMNLLGKML